MSIDSVIRAYVLNKEKMKEYQLVMKELRKQENDLINEIRNYLNERNQQEIRIDDSTLIVLTSREKKINLSKKDHEERVRTMLYSKAGISDDDLDFVKSLLDKTSVVVQEQKIKIAKEK
jgi:hypothetical protein